MKVAKVLLFGFFIVAIWGAIIYLLSEKRQVVVAPTVLTLPAAEVPPNRDYVYVSNPSKGVYVYARLVPDLKPWPVIQVIGKRGFKTMLGFVLKSGFHLSRSVLDRNSSGDMQYTVYRDTRGNRHAFVALHREDGADPTMCPEWGQITVWVNSRDALPGRKPFTYIIHVNGSVELNQGRPKESDAVIARDAVYKLLEMAETSK